MFIIIFISDLYQYHFTMQLEGVSLAKLGYYVTSKNTKQYIICTHVQLYNFGN